MWYADDICKEEVFYGECKNLRIPRTSPCFGCGSATKLAMFCWEHYSPGNTIRAYITNMIRVLSLCQIPILPSHEIEVVEDIASVM